MTEEQKQDGLEKMIENTPEELQEYITLLEEGLGEAAAREALLSKAINSFFDILNFIKENVGETSDFPVRIDSDFYNGYFTTLLAECQAKMADLKNLEPGDLLEADVF